MPLSKETLHRMARELWSVELSPAEAEAALSLLAPSLEGLAELDALDLDPLEPALMFAPAPLAAAEGAVPGDRE